MDIKRWRPELIGLILAAALTRMWALFTPNAVVFDEVYFKAFASHYLDGHYFFDIHPPLGKLLLALWAHVIGLSATSMQNTTVLGLRLLPAAAGVLLIPLTWGILRRLGASRPFAFLGAFLVLCDNAILVESRFILIDSMLLLFGLSAVYFYLVSRDAKANWSWMWLAVSALMAGAAASTKWTGLNALAIVFILWVWDHLPIQDWRTRLKELAILLLLPAVLYMGVFWVHFKLLPASGDGDAFMSTQFQATLVGNPYYNPQVHLNFWQKFVQLNVEMYRASATLTATHPYGSKWYTWPLEIRPIYYWEGAVQANGTQGNIYLLGNPVVWWGIWTALFVGFGYAWAARRKLRPATIAALALCLAAYLINLLPFIGVTRVMFLYHYFFALFFSLIAATMLWNDLATSHRKVLATNRQRAAFAAVLVVVAGGFLYFAPISYGTLLSPAGLQARMWLRSWR